jgi:hypothetical protein
MSTVPFDTHEYIKKLKAAGFSEQQAEALSVAQKDSLAQALDTALATKADIFDVKSELSDVKADIRVLKWMLGATFGAVIAVLVRLFLPGPM